MKISRYIGCMLMATIATGATARTYFNADFSMSLNGMESSNENRVYPDVEAYSQGFTLNGWINDRSGSQGFCAVCPTHNGLGMTHRSRLTSPLISIQSADAVITWRACSLHPDMPESYSIKVKPVNSQQIYTLFSTDAEASVWTDHIVTLEKFAGQTVRIIVECDSQDRYMLGLDELFVGVPEEPKFVYVDNTTYFAGSHQAHSLRGSITNMGTPVRFLSLVSVVNDVVVGRLDLADQWLTTGRTVNFDLRAYGRNDVVTPYIICGENPDGTLEELFTGEFYASDCPRTLLLDYTVDNNNASLPRILSMVGRFKERYHDAIAVIGTHIDPDPLANTDYLHNIGFNQRMKLMFNRDKDIVGDAEGRLNKLLKTPAGDRVTITDIELHPDSTAADVTVEVLAYKGRDNADDSYRLGYTITADLHDPDNDDYAVTNLGTSTSYGVYYFMPENVAPALVYMHDVNVGAPDAANGIPGLLPASLLPGQPVTCRFTVDLPEGFDTGSLKLVTYIMDDNDAGRVLNADTRPVAGSVNSNVITEDCVYGNTLAVDLMPGRICRLSGLGSSPSVTLSLYAIDGRLIDSSGYAANADTLDIPLDTEYRGAVIIKAVTATATAAAKAQLR